MRICFIAFHMHCLLHTQRLLSLCVLFWIAFETLIAYLLVVCSFTYCRRLRLVIELIRRLLSFRRVD